MWVLMYITVFIVMFFSGSPFMGMLALFLLSFFLAMTLGMKTSWLMMMLILVYVGGIMIMFTYMTSVLSYSKISFISIRLMVSLLFIMSLFGGSLINSPSLLPSVWPAVSFMSNNIPFLLFLVNYMLLTLVSVFMMVMKEEGPMKMK